MDMSEDGTHKQEFVVRDLPTTSVTFFPTKANVVRDIRDVTLKAGANEITIYGVTPTADENSIKVDGKGSATITDIMVELVPNRDRYEDIYPSDSDEGSDSDSTESDPEDEELENFRKKQRDLDWAIKQAQEQKASASARLNILESYGKSVDKSRPTDITRFLESYESERRKAFVVFDQSEKDLVQLIESQAELAKTKQKHQEAALKSKAKALKSQAAADKRKAREKEKRRLAKRQTKVDRINFWPKKVYKITVSIDSLLDLTPGTSRRGSVSSLGKAPSESEIYHVNLSISYITSSASWAPRYDLSLHTPTHSGTILYRAEFRNSTSELWKDAKVVLSTSTSAFQGLGELIPQMQPWSIDLTKKSPSSGLNLDALYSFQEKSYKTLHHYDPLHKGDVPRDTLFGLDNIDHQSQQMLLQVQAQNQHRMQRHQNLLSNNKSMPAPGGLFGQQQAQQQSSAFGANQARAVPTQPPGGVLFGGSNASSTNNVGFGGSGGGAPMSGGLFASRSAGRRGGNEPTSITAQCDEQQADLEIDFDVDGATITPDMPSLDTQESSWSESGLTVNYDISGLRTIPPSFTFRRHRLATVNLKEVQLHHLLIPKLRAAAFLKARIRNNSSTSFLRGLVGVTLDGSFLGNTTLPRCSAGETFNLNLGVDPSVSVKYPKPEVRKSQSGILNKESSSIYMRACTVTNTKSNGYIEGLLLDQVPVSSEERLRVDILRPKGLRHEGDAVGSGTGLTLAGKEDPKWGKAKAVLKKSGEICFDFRIEGGKGARFAVEYETRHPTSEAVISM